MLSRYLSIRLIYNLNLKRYHVTSIFMYTLYIQTDFKNVVYQLCINVLGQLKLVKVDLSSFYITHFFPE